MLSTIRAEAWKYGCYLLALLLVLAAVAAGVQSWRLARAKEAAAVVARDYAKAEARAEGAARREEASRAEAVTHIAAAYQRGIRDGQAAADDLRADVQSGRLLLRDRFKCPAAKRGVGQVAASPAGGDGEEGAVLSPEDQEFLVRIGAEADEVVRQLQACQAIVIADRSR